MTRFALFLLLALSFSACKTTKKTASGASSATISIKTDAKVDSIGTASDSSNTQEDEFTELEQTVTTFVPLDSVGFTVFKPITTSTRSASGRRASAITQQASTIDLKADRKVDLDSIGTMDFDQKETIENASVVGEIADVLFPSWIKIVALFITLITTVILSRIDIKKAKSTGIPPA
jgi:ABC-type Fe3+-hydroxamate transport system substrate-binding protein